MLSQNMLSFSLFFEIQKHMHKYIKFENSLQGKNKLLVVFYLFFLLIIY
jgi:hypothetical protein